MWLARALGIVLLSLLAGCADSEVTPLSPTVTTTVAEPLVADRFVGDFETGNFDQWANCQNVLVRSEPCTSYHNPTSRMEVESAVVRQGRYAARFEVHQGDMPANLCCGDRAEVSGEEATRSDEGDDRWYQWSTRFGAGFPADRGWTVLSQWHADEDGPPPLAVASGPTNVGMNRWGVVVSTYDAPGHPGPTFTPWSAEIVTDSWIDIKMHVKWSVHDEVGFIELWIGGVPQVFGDAPCAGQTRCMVRTLMPRGGGTYFKQGYYRDPAIDAPGVVYHDGFTAAKNEAALAPL
ncbi:polysaccharide lyase [Nocardia acidivorans]|uniref:polysaccharide lyase n=1 Tax=Nocardia acidivorans TaxID=404580 RepID=UPI000A002FBC|nr:polysaccharide lyase [Nocardia acidivorans]